MRYTHLHLVDLDRPFNLILQFVQLDMQRRSFIYLMSLRFSLDLLILQIFVQHLVGTILLRKYLEAKMTKISVLMELYFFGGIKLNS